MLLNFADEAAKLPASMPKSVRALRFTDRVARTAGTPGKRISNGSLRKRAGFSVTFCSFAEKKGFIEVNPLRNLTIDGGTKGTARRAFRDSELADLFASPLFTDPASWTKTRFGVTDRTLF